MNLLYIDKKWKDEYSAGMDVYANFRAFLRDQIARFGSPEAAADEMGVSSRSVRHWMKTGRGPQRSSLEKISKKLDIPEKEILSWGEDQLPESTTTDEYFFAGVPYFEAEPSGSEGEGLVLSKKVKSYLVFNSHWIYSKGNPNNMGVVRVSGPSMEPTIPNGAVVLVDESRTKPSKNKIFLIAHNEGLQVKRVDWDDLHWILRSDNEEVGDIVVRKENFFQILGKIIWVAYEIV